MASLTWTTDGDRRYGERGAHAFGTERVAQGATRLESGRGAPRIWAVGGGKGGVGKSVISSNLAAAMAGAGRRCTVIDVDLGGANLHTLLGVSRPRYSLSHLLTGDVSSLADLMVQTSVPNLWLVSGNQALLEMANPTHSQKEMLVRQIRGLDVDDVVLDLGAGSAFNVLDFFLLARRGLVVVTPEPTAIENAEHFIRVAFYRSLREVARRPDVAAVIRQLRENGRARRLHSAGELIALVRAIDPIAAKLLEEQAQSFAPLLIVNQVQAPEHRGIGPRLAASCRERLGAAIEFAGSIEADLSVAAAVARGQPALQAFPLCRFSKHIEALAERLQREDPEFPREHEVESGRASRRAAPRRLRGRCLAVPTAAPARSGRARRLPAPVSRGAGPEPRRHDRADADPQPRSDRERALRPAAARALSQGLPVRIRARARPARHRRAREVLPRQGPGAGLRKRAARARSETTLARLARLGLDA